MNRGLSTGPRTRYIDGRCRIGITLSAEVKATRWRRPRNTMRPLRRAPLPLPSPSPMAADPTMSSMLFSRWLPAAYGSPFGSSSRFWAGAAAAQACRSHDERPNGQQRSACRPTRSHNGVRAYLRWFGPTWVAVALSVVIVVWGVSTAGSAIANRLRPAPPTPEQSYLIALHHDPDPWVISDDAWLLGQGQQFCREKANAAALFAEGKVTEPFDPTKTAAAESITGFLSEVTSFFITDVERRHAELLTTSASTYLCPHVDDAREVVDVFVLPTS